MIFSHVSVLGFVLNLRSYMTLWLLTGLAVAADQNFKTFQAAYPYVVRKLIYDNSAATRRILYSVLLLFFLVIVSMELATARIFYLL